ncbi:YxeA family protein [Bacillus cereus]|uniref:DUF1093 domain-containing protein n=1 Tax=Bacillus cereus TaxID=1396 RepID=UPI000BF58AD8|nr:YxeA family protein [Bacillus cereus]PEQ49311.1 hypothetical protein CN469_31005 [Bacillus cereus]
MGKLSQDKYYVQITTDGIEKADDGGTSKRFNYNLTGFDKDGKEKELEFNTQKTLVKKHSYASTTVIKKVKKMYQVGKK